MTTLPSAVEFAMWITSFQSISKALYMVLAVCYNRFILKKEGKQMNTSESSRIILGLRAAGWDEKSINDFILWVETGEEQYKPKEKK